MAVRQDSKKKYFFDVHYVKRGINKRYRSKAYGTKKEAVKAERLFLENVQDLSDDDYTFNEIADMYLARKKPNCKKSTYDNAVGKLAIIRKELGEIPLQRLTVAQFSEFIEKMNTSSSKKKSRSNRTKMAWSERQKNAVLSLVRALCKFARTYYGIVCDVPYRFDRWKVRTIDEKRYLTEEEFSKFAAEVSDEGYRLFYTFLMYTGLRRGEALGLQIKDIDYEKKVAHITKSFNKCENALTTPKNQSSVRSIPLCQKAYDCAVKLKDMYCSGYLFGGDTPYPFTKIDRVKNKACDKAGIQRFRIHDLRHSFVSLLVNSGADVSLVAQYVGHSDVEQTLNTYSHLYAGRLETVISRL